MLEQLPSDLSSPESSVDVARHADLGLAAMDVDILAVQVVDRAEASVGNLQQERNLPVSLIHRGKLSCDHPDA